MQTADLRGQDPGKKRRVGEMSVRGTLFPVRHLSPGRQPPRSCEQSRKLQKGDWEAEQSLQQPRRDGQEWAGMNIQRPPSRTSCGQHPGFHLELGIDQHSPTLKPAQFCLVVRDINMVLVVVTDDKWTEDK